MKLLIDGDILVFRCGFAAERAKWFLRVKDGETLEFDYKKEALNHLDIVLPGKYSRQEGEDYHLWSERFVEPVEHALHNVNVTISKILEGLDASEWDVSVYLSGENNFRYEVAKTKPYKGNRDRAHRPTHEQAIKEHIISKWPTIISEGEEADDVMGYTQCRLDHRKPLESVIVTQDKDLDMIPGLKYDFVEQVAYSITEEQAYYNFCTQWLMGDSTDNIPGLPKVGKATAAKLLGDVGDADPETLNYIVACEYMRRSPRPEKWWEYMREQGKLVWIRREPDQIWEPPIDAESLERTTEELQL